MDTQDHLSDGVDRQPIRKGAPTTGAPGRPPRTNLHITYHTATDEADMERATALLQAWIQRGVETRRSARKATS